MMKKKVLFILISILTAAVISAEGNETANLLRSPSLTLTGGSYTSTESPSADIINPAASALQQRITAEINFTSLFGDAADSGYDGSAFGLGLSYPTRAGVITGNGFLMGTNTALTEINPGTFQGGLSASFAKELYPDLLTGIGIDFTAGESWYLGADIGFIKYEGDISFMKDFRWAAALNNFGYSGFSTTDISSPFTIGGGAAFDLVSTDNIFLALNSDLIIPSLFNFDNINMRLSVGADAKFFDFIGLKTTAALDVRELAAGDTSALIPAFGIYVDLTTNFNKDDDFLSLAERGWGQSDVQTTVAVSPMANDLWSVGAGAVLNLGVVDRDAPAIELDLSGFEEAVEDQDATQDYQSSDNVSFIFPSYDDGGRGKSAGLKKTVEKRTVNDAVSKSVKKSSDNPGNINAGPDDEKIIAYISPNNDGIKDEITIPVKITDSRYIKGFAFIIEDEEGNEVKRIENKEKRPENTSGIANFFLRLFYVEKGVDIPESIRWDGMNNNGSVVDDGVYIFYMQAWDDNNNISTTSKYAIVVDNTAPELAIGEISSDNKIFSPNNDGNKDELEITQSGSGEDSWNAVIKNTSGKVMKNFVWQKQSPETFSWDGKDDKKLLLPDGVYFYYISSTDRAGNSTEDELSNIIINTQSTPISLSLDNAYIAPGISGSKETLVFQPEIPVKTGITEWRLTVRNNNGLVVRTFSGASEVPAIVSFDGRNDSGQYLDEGLYKATLQIIYINGNRPVTDSPQITVDKTAPRASTSASLKIFSPNGDGKKDSVVIYQETSTEDVWYGQITDGEGTVVKSYKWVSNADQSIEWLGYTDDGKLAADGDYSYRLYTSDRAGNTGDSEALNLTLDTEATPVIITAGTEAFSPDGDGTKDIITFSPVLNVTGGIQSYTINVKDSSGKAIKKITGRGALKKEFTWDGFTDDGRKAVDGTYQAELEVVYEKGDISKAVSREFVIDTVYPAIDINAEYLLFSPDSDNRKDSVTVSQKTSTENLFTGVIKDKNGNTIKDYLWKGTADSFTWDGTDNQGNKVADGSYYYSIVAVDPAGNKTEKTLPALIIDTRQVNVFATADSSGFTPNNDSRDDRIEFSTMTTLREGVEKWSFEILKNGVSPVKTFEGTALPEKIIWDGTDDSGKVVEGVFKARYRVEFKKGNLPESLTKEFSSDITAPKVTVSMAPQPFSPDNDGIDDELTISLAVSDMSAIDSWSLDIVDREGNAFTSFSGNGQPSDRIIWDGLSSTGELVGAAEDYPYRLKVTDEFGNSNESYGIIPIDVLVVREGDKLKIRIANITFAPDSPELLTTDAEIKAKNEYVLGRLSEILKKYESYKIMIEGHAVSVWWSDSARAKKEQEEELLPLSKARAETVKNYLSKLGISSLRMSTVGIGGSSPIVPHSDLDNRWKNRRVEFILIK